MTVLSSQLQLFSQAKGRFPGDCDANGVIDYAADVTDRGDMTTEERANLYAFTSVLPVIPAAGADAALETNGCALTGGTGTATTVVTNTTNANVWLNDLKLAGMVSDSAPNRGLAKAINEDFVFVGKITDNGAASADGADYNAIVIHNVPQWMAQRMAVAINGQDAVANRSRLRSLTRVDPGVDGSYEATWQVIAAPTADTAAMRDAMVTVAYFFDRIPESKI